MAVPIETVTMPGADDQEIRLQLERWSRETFDLAHGPLLRVRLIEVGADDHVLMIVIHHIISDAWSLDILQREFFGAYSAAMQGREARFPELPLQFADYAAWQCGAAQREALDRQLAHWQDKLRGAPPVLEIPTDRIRPPKQSYAGARVRELVASVN